MYFLISHPIDLIIMKLIALHIEYRYNGSTIIDGGCNLKSKKTKGKILENKFFLLKLV